MLNRGYQAGREKGSALNQQLQRKYDRRLSATERAPSLHRWMLLSLPSQVEVEAACSLMSISFSKRESRSFYRVSGQSPDRPLQRAANRRYPRMIEQRCDPVANIGRPNFSQLKFSMELSQNLKIPCPTESSLHSLLLQRQIAGRA